MGDEPEPEPQSLYVVGVSPRGGAGVVAAGLVELISDLGRVGVFRPIALVPPDQDPLLQLLKTRHQLAAPFDAMAGVSGAEAETLAAEGRFDELVKRILARYREREAEVDVTVCVSSDITQFVTGLELDFNLEIANNLGAAVLPVLSGRGLDGPRLANAVRLLREALAERRCDHLATFVTKVDPARLGAWQEDLRREFGDGVPVYLLPNQPLLDMPTVGEIQQALGAHWVFRNEGDRQREISGIKVAAMELTNFLDHVREGIMVITPVDRADILLGSLLAHGSTTYPHVGAVLLSGGLAPPPQITRLLEGFPRSPVPILAAPTDTYDTALAATNVEAGLPPDNPRKVAAALGLVESAVDPAWLRRRLSAARPRRITPWMFEYELLHRARQRRTHIVLPEGNDARILRAAEILRLRDVCDLTLLGDEDEVRDAIAGLGLQLSDIPVINPRTSAWREEFAQAYFEARRHKGISDQMAADTITDVSYFGSMMVHLGKVHGMVSGAAHTTQHTIRPAFEFIKMKPGRRVVSSVFFMCLPDRVLVYGDCAVNPDPDAEELADIALSSAETAAQFGVEPRIALLSYSTGESGKGADVDKVRTAARIAKERRPDLLIEGPIQYDAAVDASVASAKLPGSDVAGSATVFIFPDLNTGNNTYKAVQRTAGVVAVGPVLQGLRKPVNDLSRGCLVPDVVNTVAITAIQAAAEDGSRG